MEFTFIFYVGTAYFAFWADKLIHYFRLVFKAHVFNLFLLRLIDLLGLKINDFLLKDCSYSAILFR